jgi:uncharacterized oxidoreductase
MSNTEIRVVTGPANYFSHPGSLSRLNDFFTADQLSRAVWVYGERASMRPPLSARDISSRRAKRLLFTGHCSETDVAQLAKESGENRSVVIGVGGGHCSTPLKRWPVVWICRLSVFLRLRDLRCLDAALRLV